MVIVAGGKILKLCITCAFGLEALVKRQLLDLGYNKLEVNDGRIYLEAGIKDIASLNLRLRSADRILIELASFKAKTFEELFQGVRKIDWARIISPDGNFIVEGRSFKSKLFSISDSQAITEKAIVDKLKETYKISWFSKAKERYRIEISLVKDIATITLDTSGEGLHKRGYRKYSGRAPLRENLAASLVDLSFANKDRPLVDLFCGSGTIAIEAARIFRNIAPGIDRDFDFIHWSDENKKIYKKEKSKCLSEIDYESKIDILATDIDGGIIDKAIINAENAGVREDIRFVTRDFRKVVLKDNYPCLISNPPYGNRLGDILESEKLYQDLGKKMAKLKTSSEFIISDCEDFEKFYGSKASKNRKVYNGNIKCYYYQYYGPRPR